MSQYAYKFDEKDCTAAIGEWSKGEIEKLACDCGCDASIFVSRDARALWVLSQLSWKPMMSLIGLETQADFDAFMGRLEAAEKTKRRMTELWRSKLG